MLTRLKVGTVFARNYRVLALLAEGGFGTVYRVEQTDNGKLRALKILQGGLVADPRMRERFTQEARIGAMIESDHVVEVSAAGIDEATGTPWLAMELLDGSDLAQVMERERRLSPARVLSVLEDVCDALAAAHAKGILHLDLKPENLFLARKRLRGVSEVVKVLDFGIARIAAEGRRSATVTTTLGTCLWASPEQAQKAAKVSPASDVWALGVIAFYLLTGKHYWDAANVEPGEKINNVAVVVEVQTSTLPPASVRARKLGVADALPAGFDRWFGRCVARQAGKRYRDAGQLIAGLRETLDGRSATQVSSPPSQVSPPVAVPTVALDGETKKRTKKPPRSAIERGLAEAQDKSASSSAASATQLLSEAPQAPLLPPIAVLTEVMGGGRKKRAKNPPAKPATRKSAAEARNKPTPPSAAPSSPAVLATQVLGEVPQAPVLPPIAVPTEVMGGDGAGRAKRTPPKSAKRDVGVTRETRDAGPDTLVARDDEGGIQGRTPGVVLRGDCPHAAPALQRTGSGRDAPRRRDVGRGLLARADAIRRCLDQRHHISSIRAGTCAKLRGRQLPRQER